MVITFADYRVQKILENYILVSRLKYRRILHEILMGIQVPGIRLPHDGICVRDTESKGAAFKQAVTKYVV